jgi:hypothetical protein
MLFYISKVLFVYQQVIIVQKYASKSWIFHFLKTVLSHLNQNILNENNLNEIEMITATQIIERPH